MVARKTDPGISNKKEASVLDYLLSLSNRHTQGRYHEALKIRQ
jgi:hypothetical protein